MAHTVLELAWGNSAQVAGYTGPAREVVINTDDGSFNIQDGVTAGGGWKNRSRTGGGGYAYATPLTGTTVTFPSGPGERIQVLDPAGGLAALTVNLPAAPQDGDTCELMSSQVITALTVNAPAGATVNGNSFTMSPNSGASWMYRSANTTWYRRY